LTISISVPFGRDFFISSLACTKSHTHVTHHTKTEAYSTPPNEHMTEPMSRLWMGPCGMPIRITESQAPFSPLSTLSEKSERDLPRSKRENAWWVASRSTCNEVICSYNYHTDALWLIRPLLMLTEFIKHTCTQISK